MLADEPTAQGMDRAVNEFPILAAPAAWSAEKRHRAEAIVRNAVRLLDDASLLATYHRHGTAFTLAIFSLEEAGKVALQIWGDTARLRAVDSKWTSHIKKQAAATSLLQAEIANRALKMKFDEWRVPSQAACSPEQFEQLREHLAKALYESREHRLSEYVALGATERVKHVSLYVDDWSLDHEFAAGQGDVPLDVENREAGVAWVDGYAAFDVSSRAQCLA
jgi:AbiV family abortive infection protein